MNVLRISIYSFLEDYRDILSDNGMKATSQDRRGGDQFVSKRLCGTGNNFKS